MYRKFCIFCTLCLVLVSVILFAGSSSFGFMELFGKEGYKSGQWVENIEYQNAFLELSFEMPEKWTSLETSQWFENDIENNLQVQTLENEGVVCEFTIEKDDNVLQFDVEDLEKTVGSKKITESDYLAALQNQIDEVEKGSCECEEIYEVEVGGKDFTFLPVYYSDNNIKQLYGMCNQNGYMLQIIATYKLEDEVEIKNVIDCGFESLVAQK